MTDDLLAPTPRAQCPLPPGASLTLPAPAKLNLFLHVTGRRDDGYHLLQTVFQLVDYGDTLTLRPRSDSVIELLDTIEQLPTEQNLIFRAARLLQEATRCPFGASIGCAKRLPPGGGLGGGSSNAATALVGLNHLWQTGLERTDLARLGLQLGADVPVFVEGHSAWAEGVGEALQPVNLPARYFLIIDPGVQVPTAMIFRDQHLTRNTEAITLAAFLDHGGRNDCEPVARRLFPAVEQTLDWLSRYTTAHLTGTGGCVFASFADRHQAERVAASVPAGWPTFIAKGVDQSPLIKALEHSHS